MDFKALNGLGPEYLFDVFTGNSGSHLRPLRNTSADLQLPKKTTNDGQRCFSYTGTKLWNALPLKTKQASSLQAFKMKLNLNETELGSFCILNSIFYLLQITFAYLCMFNFDMSFHYF